MTIKLTDIQLVLLTSAAQRADGSVFPPPESVAGETARIRKAIPSLLKRKLIAEVDGAGTDQVWRENGERRIGAVIMAAGRAAIGVDEPAPPVANNEVQPSVPAVATKPPTKAAQVVALLQREQGATLADLVAATGWLPHTTRAALTGLRKKGHAITSTKAGDVRTYHASAAEAA